MTLTEVFLLVITVSTLASAGALIGILLRLIGAVRMLEALARDVREPIRRIGEAAGELRSLMHRASREYGLVSEAAGLVLREVVHPVIVVASLVRGVRTGIGAFLRPRRPLLNSTHDERSGT